MLSEHKRLGVQIKDDLVTEEHYNFLITVEASRYIGATSKKFVYQFLEDEGLKALREEHFAIQYPPEKIPGEI